MKVSMAKDENKIAVRVSRGEKGKAREEVREEEVEFSSSEARNKSKADIL